MRRDDDFTPDAAELLATAREVRRRMAHELGTLCRMQADLDALERRLRELRRGLAEEAPATVIAACEPGPWGPS